MESGVKADQSYITPLNMKVRNFQANQSLEPTKAGKYRQVRTRTLRIRQIWIASFDINRH